MRNKTKVFLAILSMALSFALSFACTVYASPLVDHDRQTAAVASEPETAPAPERSAEPVIQDIDYGPIAEAAFEPLCDDGTEWAEAPGEEENANTLNNNRYAVMENGVQKPAEKLPFTVEGNVSRRMQSTQLEYWNRVPESVRTAFEEDGWEFVLTDKSIAGTYYGTELGNIAGLTKSSEKVIYIEDRESAIRRATGHEFGHYVDVAYGWASLSDEWVAIYEEEKDQLNEIGGVGDGHTTSSATEYFAEVFQQVINYPDSCKESAPQSYEYIMGLLENFDELDRATAPKEEAPVITPEPAPVITPEPTFVVETPASVPVPAATETPDITTPVPVVSDPTEARSKTTPETQKTEVPETTDTQTTN